MSQMSQEGGEASKPGGGSEESEERDAGHTQACTLNWVLARSDLLSTTATMPNARSCMWHAIHLTQIDLSENEAVNPTSNLATNSAVVVQRLCESNRATRQTAQAEDAVERTT
jgi:hypothetical protein